MQSLIMLQWGRYHGFVESGVDLEFKRGNDPGEVLDGGDPTKPPYSNLKNKVACLFKNIFVDRNVNKYSDWFSLAG